MGQQAQSGGRRATLDDKKRRAAGRGNDRSPEREAIKDSVGLAKQKGGAGGAFGKGGVGDRPTPAADGASLASSPASYTDRD